MKVHLPKFLWRKDIEEEEGEKPDTRDQTSWQEIANMVEFLAPSIYLFIFF